MKTIREIAEEIGVSKQAVQQKMSRDPLCTRIQANANKIGNKMYVDEIGEMLIKTAFKQSKTTTKSPTKTTTLCTCVHAENRFLHEQLHIKDKQIAELTGLLKLQASSKNPRPKKVHKKRLVTIKSGAVSKLIERGRRDLQG